MSRIQLKLVRIRTSVVIFNVATLGTTSTQLGLPFIHPPTFKGSPNTTGVGKKGCTCSEGVVALKGRGMWVR